MYILFLNIWRWSIRFKGARRSRQSMSKAFRLSSAPTQALWNPLDGRRSACFGRGMRRSHLAFSFLLLLLSSAAVWAQVGAAISGTVSDATGAPVAGVNVTVKSVETGAKRVVTTDENGVYRAPSLPIG